MVDFVKLLFLNSSFISHDCVNFRVPTVRFVLVGFCCFFGHTGLCRLVGIGRGIDCFLENAVGTILIENCAIRIVLSEVVHVICFEKKEFGLGDVHTVDTKATGPYFRDGILRY